MGKLTELQKNKKMLCIPILSLAHLGKKKKAKYEWFVWKQSNKCCI